MSKVMEDYISIFKDIHFHLRKMGRLISGISFSEKDDKVELYGLVSLNLCKQQTEAIYLLLEKKLYPSVLMLVRNIFESFFDFQWILRAETKEEKIERANQLEGKSFNDIEKELNVMKEDSQSSDPIWKSEMYQDKEEFLELLKTHYPELVIDIDGKKKFKEPKEHSFENRLNRMERLKFYSIYRFTSAFVHPSPLIRDVVLLREGSDKTPLQILEPHLYEILDYCLFLIYGIANNLIKVLDSRIDSKKEDINKILTGIFMRIKNSNAGLLINGAI